MLSPELDPAIAEFYQRTSEEDRLRQGPFVLEEIRTRRGTLLRVAQMLELETAVLGTSAHLLAVARRAS